MYPCTGQIAVLRNEQCGGSARQDVEQEAAQELGGGERHGLVTRPALGAVVLVAEGDAVVVGGD